MTQGFLTCPEMQNILTPPSVLARWEKALPPSAAITGIEAKVSVLLTVVGQPYKPFCAGNGGLKRG